MTYKAYNIKSLRKLPQITQNLPEEEIKNIEIAAKVFPFKVSNYVLDLIDWKNYKDDAIFRLVFPQKEMLKEEDFNRLKNASPDEIDKIVYDIRMSLNPHPAGQKENIPEINGIKLAGSQHKYKETILFFPRQGQTCHAYCSFCFRWPQFTGINELKFAMKEVETLIDYIKANPTITDILFTGGDPMVMSAKLFKMYIDAIIEAKIPHLQNIRIGSKALAFWPYRFISDSDSQELLDTFKKIVDNGYHLAFMAHFNHYKELETDAVREAIKNIQKTGAIIRTQAPILNHINASSEVWEKMWKEQVKLGLIPYYMFIARDTGAKEYFDVPLAKAYEIYKNAISKVSGLARTVRGPSMSAAPGKIAITGVSEINGKKVFVLNMLQAKNPSLVNIPFFAEYDEKASWIDDLKPAFANKFIFE
ncbi:MAG: lysine 2,3-aminomutase [Nautiliaceae bacterium]